jgi:hypothetical protein
MFIYIMIHLYGPTVTKLNIFAVVTNLAHCKIFSVNQPEKIWSSEAYVLHEIWNISVATWATVWKN